MRATAQLHYPLINPLAMSAAILLLILTPPALAAPKFRVLHNFGAGNDGAGLWSSVIFDRKGNLYGATSGGGTSGDGAVFELVRTSGGSWKESLLHSFSPPTDGSSPNGPLAMDAAGGLYGVTQEGGTYLGGTVFKLTPSSGRWSFTVLYQVGSKYGDVILDQAGNLYGSIGAGTYGYGAIAELSPGSDGWSYQVLYGAENAH
jgi:uncharacterized repeat protein (TIGR03803 family)